MPATIDVYKDWLHIEATNRPLNYYQLLKLPEFEDDTIKIRKSYRQLNAHIRKYATGEFIDESQSLLNEMAKAMLCLTDASRKQDYDQTLGRKTTSTRRRMSFGNILVGNKIATAEQLQKCQKYADAIGLELHQAVLQQKIAAAEIVMLAFAESVGLPFISLEDVGVEENIAPQINPNTARQHSFVPVMVDQGQLILASPSPIIPDVEDELRMLFDMPVRSVICVPTQINVAVAKYYPRDAVQLIASKGSAAATKKVAAGKEKETAKDKADKPSRSAAVAGPKTPMNDEEKKMRIQYSIVGFNFPLIVTILGCQMLAPQFSVIYAAGIGITLGCAGAGIAWSAMSR